MCINYVGLIFVAIIVAVVIGVIGLVVVLATSSRRSGSVPVTPVMPDTPMPSRDERQAILEQLAQGKITKDQAKERLGALGTPVPTDMAAPAPRPASGRGCLIAVLVGAILIPLVLVLLWGVLGVCSLRF